MKLQSYIESGILELYALDQLDPGEREDVEGMLSVFPRIRAEHDKIQGALEMYANSCAIEPSSHVKKKLSESISNLEKEEIMDLQNLPLITNFSDHAKWLDLVKEMIPEKIGPEGFFTSPLQQSDNVVQLLVVSSTDVGDEVHNDVHESFLILKGRCKCTMGNEVRFMEDGDFMTIPLNEQHVVEILSDRVVAILQHVAV